MHQLIFFFFKDIAKWKEADDKKGVGQGKNLVEHLNREGMDERYCT